ncbi:MAG: 2-C-methyl-D-erythritol 2,4-cyclodiphosphate synthase [Chitinivibrionales bacterium]|nr:2-C-methyl-D-erythritol 2,4-cyclodiphosphate synthase [Chitinivibrionales bacterium]
MHISAIGQDSHRFEHDSSAKPLVLGGVIFEQYPGLQGNSDADVILHALTNAISGLTTVNVLGPVSDKLCLEEGVTDSSVYLRKALESLGAWRLSHVSVSIEGKRPKLSTHLGAIRASLAGILDLSQDCIGITATTGEGLTAFGKGEGLQVLAIASASRE